MTHTHIEDVHPTAGGMIAIAAIVGMIVILSGCAGLVAWFVSH